MVLLLFNESALKYCKALKETIIPTCNHYKLKKPYLTLSASTVQMDFIFFPHVMKASTDCLVCNVRETCGFLDGTFARFHSQAGSTHERIKLTRGVYHKSASQAWEIFTRERGKIREIVWCCQIAENSDFVLKSIGKKYYFFAEELDSGTAIKF